MVLYPLDSRSSLFGDPWTRCATTANRPMVSDAHSPQLQAPAFLIEITYAYEVNEQLIKQEVLGQTMLSDGLVVMATSILNCVRKQTHSDAEHFQDSDSESISEMRTQRRRNLHDWNVGSGKPYSQDFTNVWRRGGVQRSLRK
ncbi:hypothetical protein CISG_08847 [Coccidioides immitis RMSCC 3703]|uniref:Uncharacterized protein n=2 Tax=Coccidioides immitis TaxID=5501 RepID=A0A0J8RAT5_COCIT|nr:hypothetical protein CIRG_05109 [Coccidioides immitis RMSCC 2394]KMU80998.1 hypothetical protein CISG_08847 [Coccidioides immitis RMSCC 3703]